MTKLMPGILAMTAIVAASNILVQYTFGNWLTWGAFTYPFAFLVTDLTNRLQGPKAARRVVIAGFLAGLACSFIAAALDMMTLRIALASGLAFLTAQLVDIKIFDRLRGGRWWQAPLASTVLGAALDTAIFFSVAFSATFIWLNPGDDVSWAGGALPLLGVGPEGPLWVSLAVADWLVKLTLAVLALVPFRMMVTRLRRTNPSR